MLTLTELGDDLEIRPFTNRKLIRDKFYFHDCVDDMDNLIGYFQSDILMGYLSYSINDDSKEIIISFIESIHSWIGIGTNLIKYLMLNIYKEGYVIETLVSTVNGEEFFRKMLRKNLIPVGSRVEKI